MPPEEMTGSTHILEFMCYAIAGSAGIRFRMEMVMSSSSDASAQRRRRRVGRRRGVLRGFAGAALRAGARAASRARRGRGPGPGARRRAVGPDAVRAERGAQARQSQRASTDRILTSTSRQIKSRGSHSDSDFFHLNLSLNRKSPDQKKVEPVIPIMTARPRTKERGAAG